MCYSVNLLCYKDTWSVEYIYSQRVIVLNPSGRTHMCVVNKELQQSDFYFVLVIHFKHIKRWKSLIHFKKSIKQEQKQMKR